MNPIPDIRKYFTPLQPVVGNHPGMSYTELLPDMCLGHYIYCYWELKTTSPLDSPFHYKVVADACTDIFFDANNPEDLQVMGFSPGYREFPLGRQFHYVGIRFLPAVFPLLFGVKGGELTGRVEALDMVIPRVFREILLYISPGISFVEYKHVFDRYFARVADTVNSRIDHRFFNAMDLVIKKRGTLRVQDELDTGISSRQLRRLFDFYVGSTPKTFSKVIRFQHILNAKPSVQSLRENKLFFDAGYYDQSHFIKEFKAMYGTTPSEALNPGK